MNTNRSMILSVFTRTTALIAVVIGIAAPILNARVASANAIGGPYAANNLVLAAGASKTYTVAFRADETALISGIGDGDIDIEVYTLDGVLVAWDRLSNYKPKVTWVPSQSDTFYVKITNADSRRAACDISFR